MSNRRSFSSFYRCEYHKGFYNDSDAIESLSNIKYTDFWELPNDDDFPYDTAFVLLFGSCNHFALSLQNKLGYKPYIIENQDDKGFHAFCQIYSNRRWYYVDARGITSSFNEFMDVAKNFVTGEYVIRPVNSDDIAEWENYGDYDKEAYAFAEAIIEKYKECYIL